MIAEGFDVASVSGISPTLAFTKKISSVSVVPTAALGLIAQWPQLITLMIW